MPKKNLQRDAKHFEVLEDVTFAPFFILGLHRSGTTLLYQLLHRQDAFNTLTLHDVVHYGEILADHLAGTRDEKKAAFNRELQSFGDDTRVIDRVKLSADTMEEYGYILRRFAPQRALGSLRPRTAVTNAMSLKPHNREEFARMCRKLQYVGGNRKPLLLKNPWDFVNFHYVKEQFPQAKFVFIHRDPLDTLNSRLRALSVLGEGETRLHRLLEGREPGSKPQVRDRLMKVGNRLMSHLVRKEILIPGAWMADQIESYLVQIPALAEEDYLEVRYEDLVANPGEELGRVTTFLGIPGPPRLRPEEIEPRRVPHLPVIEASRRRLAGRLEAYTRRFGYEL